MVIVLMFAAVTRVPLVCQASDLGLINALELKQNTAGWMILDGRPENAWKTNHIPGSFSFSWETHTHTDENGIQFRILSQDRLAEALGNLGISRDTPVVVYGDADKSWGGEGWICWMLGWLGHSGPIRLLSGGVQAWERNGFVLESYSRHTPAGKKKNEAGTVYVPILHHELNISAKALFKEKEKIQLVDTRSIREWFFGHLPGAVHIPWKKFINGVDHTPLDRLETLQLLKKHGINPEKPVVYYCTGGIRSAYAWMVHELSELPMARNFEGGTEAWDTLIP
ncbi:sulfurtransferase [Desulfobacula phenolica]|nr:rhodanese-like domain-containing protein [Desulfobacula phenolica]